MKKSIFTVIVLLSLAALPARAEENVSSQPGSSAAILENNFRNALWSGSTNASGLGFAPLSDYAGLHLLWNSEEGDLSRQQEGTGFNDVSLKTSGATSLKGFTLWGSFLFQNKFDRGCKYNCTVYDADVLMPYYAADTVASDWNRQNYELSAKVASPLLLNRLRFGFEINYDAKVGAKQADPRTEDYKYSMDIHPSFTIKLGGKDILGAAFRYENGFERSELTNANTRFDKVIWLMNGLGNATTWKVGGNDGLKTYYYKSNLFGGSLQWGRNGQDFESLLDLSYCHRNLEGFTTPAMPKRMGRSSQNTLEGTFQCIFGEYKSDKISLDAEYATSDGYEPVQQRDNTYRNQEWVLLTENNMSSYSVLGATLSYDHLFGNDDPRGYDWKVAADARFEMEDDSYLSPAGEFNYMAAAVDLCGLRQIKMKTSTLRLGLDATMRKSLGGNYSFAGVTAKVQPLQDLYNSDLTFLTSDWVKAGARIDWDFKIGKFTLEAGADAGYAKALGRESHRLTTEVKLGLIF